MVIWRFSITGAKFSWNSAVWKFFLVLQVANVKVILNKKRKTISNLSSSLLELLIGIINTLNSVLFDSFAEKSPKK